MRLAGNTLIIVGAALMVLAGIGVLKLPDVFSRLHAGAKAAALGLGCILAGTALVAGGPIPSIKMAVAVVLQFLTAPVAAHVIGRAAYRSGVPLWDRTLYDELGREGAHPDNTDLVEQDD